MARIPAEKIELDAEGLPVRMWDDGDETRLARSSQSEGSHESQATLLARRARSIGGERGWPIGGKAGSTTAAHTTIEHMVHMTIEMPEEALASLRKDPTTFVKELRLAAAVKWYELGEVSQGRASEIAGVSRQEFVAALGRYRVSPFQYGPEEASGEAARE